MVWRAPSTIRVTSPEGDTEVMRRDNKIKYLTLQQNQLLTAKIKVMLQKLGLANQQIRSHGGSWPMLFHHHQQKCTLERESGLRRGPVN